MFSTGESYAQKRYCYAFQRLIKEIHLPNDKDLTTENLKLLLDIIEQEIERLLKDQKSKGASPDVHWNLALLYAHNLKQYKDAAEELEFYLKAYPDAPNAESIKKLIKQFREKPPAN